VGDVLRGVAGVVIDKCATQPVWVKKLFTKFHVENVPEEKAKLRFEHGLFSDKMDTTRRAFPNVS